jgi:hypothetical protein
MATIHNNFKTGAILTQGLGLAASDALITTRFHLIREIGIIIEPPIEPPTGGGGGSAYGGPAVPPAPTLAPGSRRITITINTRDSLWRKTYEVGPRPANFAVKIVNLFNNTRDFIKVTVHNIKRVPPVKATINGFSRIASNAKVLINRKNKQDSD